MGRRSPSAKRVKRLKQKVKRKLFAKAQGCPAQKNAYPNIPAEEIPNNDTDNVRGSVSGTDTCLGEDVDVVTMRTEDSLKELDEEEYEYSYEYLLECRQKLMRKVEEYRVYVEELTSKEARLIHKHREEVERIRNFYQTIAYAPTRTGRIVKAARMNSSAAAEIMTELGLKYRSTQY